MSRTTEARALPDSFLETLSVFEGSEEPRTTPEVETLDTDYCEVLDLDSRSEELLLPQGVGRDEGIVGEATVSAVDDGVQAAYTLETELPVIDEELTSESGFSGPDLLDSHDVRSGIIRSSDPSTPRGGSSVLTIPSVGSSRGTTLHSSRRSTTGSVYRSSVYGRAIPE